MAKQRDDHDQPRKKKEEPSDILPLDDLEVLDELEEVEELTDQDLVELEEPPAKPKSPPLAMPVKPPLASPVKPPLASPAGPPPLPRSPETPSVSTSGVLGKKRSAPKPPDEADDLEILEVAEESPKVPEAVKKPADPKKTKIARRSSVPTMLAPQEVSDDVEESASKLPNLSLDEPSPTRSAELQNLVPLESADAAEEVLEKLEAAPVLEHPSDVVAMELSTKDSKKAARPDSDVVDLDVIDVLDAESVSIVESMPAPSVAHDAEKASDIVEMSSDVLEAESASDVLRAAEKASDIVEMTSDVLEVESASDVLPAAEKASDIVEMTSDVLEVETASAARPPASDVVDLSEEVGDVENLEEAEPASEVVDFAEDFAPSARDMASDIFSAEDREPLSDASKKSDEVGELKVSSRGKQPSSDVLSAESAGAVEFDDEAPASGVKEDEDVLDVSETTAIGSSAVNWDDAEAVSDVKSADTGKDRGELEATVAFEGDLEKVRPQQTGDDLITMEDLEDELTGEEAVPLSGVDPVAEALESGVKLEQAAGKSKRKKPREEEETEALDEDDIDIDSIAAAGTDASTVDLGGPPSKKAKAAAVDDEDFFDSATELDAASLPSLESDEAEAAEEIEEVEAAEDVEAADEVEEVEAAEDVEELEAAEDVDEILEDLEEAEEVQAKGTKGKKKKKSAEEEAEDLLLAEDDLLSGDLEDAEALVEAAEEVDFDDIEDVKPAKKGKKSAVGLLDDEEVLEDDEAPRGKKKKKRGYDDEDGGGVATLTRKPPKPKYGRRWLGGMFLGILLAAGGAAAAWYFSPELLFEIPDSPNAKGDTPNTLKANAEKLRTEAANLRDEASAAKKEAEDEKKKADKAAADLVTAREKGDADRKALNAELKEKSDKLKDAENTINGVHAALLKEMLINKDDAPDPKILTAAVLGLGEESREYKQINKILEEGKIKETGSKGLIALFGQKKAVDDELGAIAKLLVDEKLKDPGAKGVAELLERRNALAEDRDGLNKLVVSAFDILVKGNILNAKDDPRKKLLEGVQMARLRGESPFATPLTSLATGVVGLPLGLDRLLAKGIDTAALAVEVEFFRKREVLVTGPEKDIDLHLVLLQDRTRSAPGDLDVPTREATWLLSKEAKSSADLKAKSHYVLGLVLRNQGKLVEATKSFAAALDLVKTLKGPGLWAELVAISQAELTDPHRYYIPRAHRFASEGGFKKSIDELDTGLKVMPENPHLLLARGITRLEQGRAAGKEIPPEDVAAIRDDATAAAKTPKLRPMATYVLGLLEEDQKQITKAEATLREALSYLKDEKDADAKGQRELFLAALSRVLQLDRYDEVAPAPMKDEKKEDKKADEKKEDDKKADAKDPRTDEISRLQQELAVVMLVVAFQPAEDEEEDPATKARLEESIKLAEELIASDNPKIKGQGFILKGKAVSKLGDRNEGLRLYVKGVQLLNPGKAGEDLIKLVEDHPAISYPDSAARPNRYTAEDHFGRGLHHYSFHNYPQAEKSFRQAIYWFRDDARYHYYLGLALHAQKGDKTDGKKKFADAVYAFQMGSRLEAKDLPSSDDVNLSLERIQGTLRQTLNGYRLSAVTAPVTEAPTKK